MFNSNFAPLAGMLGIGFFLHPIALPIVRSNRNQRNNERDVFLGYLFTFLSYLVIAIFGYIGFSGSYFTEYALRAEGFNRPIAQNCITMYEPTDNLAFFMRIMLFFLVFFSFPILIHFLRSSILKLTMNVEVAAAGEKNQVKKSLTQVVSSGTICGLTVGITFIPFVICVFYPQIASLLGYLGAVFGCILVYFLPVLTYLRKLKEEADNPILADVIEMRYSYLNDKLYSEKQPRQRVESFDDSVQ